MSRIWFVLAVVLAVLTVLAAGGCAREAPAAPPRHQAPPAEVAAAAVLRVWDGRRAEAWGSGDPKRLAALYTSGSVAGRRDRAMLRAWRARGLAVRGLRTQLLAVHELHHSRSTWTLQVTDRLAGGEAVGPGVRRPLPIDVATTRVIELRNVGGRWRVSAVSAAGG